MLKVKEMRKLKLTWAELRQILKESDKLMPDEEIKEITLVKPKEILIYAE